MSNVNEKIKLNRRALSDAGFEFLWSRRCNNCNAEIEVWKNPSGASFKSNLTWWDAPNDEEKIMHLHDSRTCREKQ